MATLRKTAYEAHQFKDNDIDALDDFVGDYGYVAWADSSGGPMNLPGARVHAALDMGGYTYDHEVRVAEGDWVVWAMGTMHGFSDKHFNTFVKKGGNGNEEA